MKPSVRTFPVAAVALSFFLLTPARASAQHTAGGASSVGSAVPAGGGGGSSSGGDSGSGGQSSSGSGGGESFGRSAIAGHRAANSNPPASPAGLAGGNNQVFTNYSMLSPVPAFGRPRNGLPIVGTAVPRSSLPPANGANGGGPVFIEGAYNPW